MRIFFDFDGTLADSMGQLYTCYEKFAAGNGFTPSKAEFSSLNGLVIPEVVAVLSKTHGLKDTGLEEYESMLYDTFRDDVKLYPDALSTLTSLSEQNINIYIVTSALKKYIGGFVDKHLKQYINGIVYGDDVTAHKPAPDCYLTALKRFSGNDPVIAVEDSENGVKAATSAGIFTVAIRRELPPLPLADLNIGNLTLLKAVIDERI